MNTGELLDIHPAELKFPFELKKQSSCSLQLTSRSDQYVAFKVKTTNPKSYCVRPNTGVVPPRSTCEVTVTMQAPKEAPPGMQCKDKFLLQSVVTNAGAAATDISPEMFNKEEGRVVEEFKLRVIYIPANPPSPVPEESEEGVSPTGSPRHTKDNSFLDDAAARSAYEPVENASEESVIAKLNQEKTKALRQNQQLMQELEFVRKEVTRVKDLSFSMVAVLIVGLIGFAAGYLLKLF